MHVLPVSMMTTVESLKLLLLMPGERGKGGRGSLKRRQARRVQWAEARSRLAPLKQRVAEPQQAPKNPSVRTARRAKKTDAFVQLESKCTCAEIAAGTIICSIVFLYASSPSRSTSRLAHVGSGHWPVPSMSPARSSRSNRAANASKPTLTGGCTSGTGGATTCCGRESCMYASGGAARRT